MPNKEDTLQMQIASLLSERQKGNYTFFSVPNEGILKGAAENRAENWFFAVIMKLKKMGMLPGVYDLFILKNGKSHFLEVKRADGTLGKNQRIFKANAERDGGITGEVYSLEEAEELLEKWGIINEGPSDHHDPFYHFPLGDFEESGRANEFEKTLFYERSEDE